MSNKWLFVGAFLCAGLVTACGGGGSGVSSSKKLTALSDSEITDLCEYLVDVAGSERMVDCGGGVKITTGGDTLAECTTGLKATISGSPSCAATVGDSESCGEDFADLSDSEICSLDFPTSCAAVFQCETDDSSVRRFLR
jgi:hypothetical protein